MSDWTPEDDATLLLHWAGGVSCREIGARLGRSKNSVVGRVSRLGMVRRGSPVRSRDDKCPAVPWTDADTHTVRRLWLEGLSAVEIGQRINRTPNAVEGRIKKLDLGRRASGGRACPALHEVIAASSLQVPMLQIAASAVGMPINPAFRLWRRAPCLPSTRVPAFGRCGRMAPGRITAIAKRPCSLASAGARRTTNLAPTASCIARWSRHDPHPDADH